MKAALNAAHYGAGPIAEVRQARRRAAAAAPASTPAPLRAAA